MSSQRINNLIQSMCRRPETIERLHRELDRVFDEFGLSAEERSACRQPSIEAMTAAGVHPILQMHWLLAMNPEAAEQMSIRSYSGLVED